MKIKNGLLATIVAVTVIIGAICSCILLIENPKKQEKHDLPVNFEQATFKHVEKLCSFGIRHVDTEAEKQTADYISKYLKKIGADTKVEKFEFKYKDLDNNKIAESSSCNIIGSIYPANHTDKEVIISAHWDSFNGPGALDNASGVGVMLELAKYYSSNKSYLPCIIRFVALGGEELGLLGSRSYVQTHSNELKQCKLLFNIDEVGGNEEICIEMNGGVTKESGDLTSIDSEIFAMADYKGRLLIDTLPPQYSNVPNWLKENISVSCTELNYKFNPVQGMGSDQQSFAHVGVPSTNICIAGGIKTHSPEDTPDKLDIVAFRKSGEIIAGVIDKTMELIE